MVGKTEKPIDMLAKEILVFHNFNMLLHEYHPSNEMAKLAATTQRVMSIFFEIILLRPELNGNIYSDNLAHSLLNLIVEDMAGRTTIDENILDVMEQIAFLSHALVQFSALSLSDKHISGYLTLPENIYSRNNLIYTMIENRQWQLIYSEGRFFALSERELYDVSYHQGLKQWGLVNPEQGAPVTGVVLQRLQQLGAEGISRAGGLQVLANTYNIRVDALEKYIKSNARLTLEGRCRVEAALAEPLSQRPSTLATFYDRQRGAFTATHDPKPEFMVKIEKVDHSCIDERNTLSWAKIVRLIGEALEKPITAFTKEGNVVLNREVLQKGCPTQQATVALAEKTDKADAVLSSLAGFIPGGEGQIFDGLQQYVGPGLQILADEMEGKPADQEKIQNLAETVAMQSRFAVDITPTFSSSNKITKGSDKLTAYYSKNGNIYTRISNQEWRLITAENRYFGLHDHELQEVAYNKYANNWYIVVRGKGAPITGTLLQRLHRHGPVGIERSGGLVEVAKIYQVMPNELELYLNHDATLTAFGDVLVEKTKKTSFQEHKDTLDAFYEGQFLRAAEMFTHRDETKSVQTYLPKGDSDTRLAGSQQPKEKNHVVIDAAASDKKHAEGKKNSNSATPASPKKNVHAHAISPITRLAPKTAEITYFLKKVAEIKTGNSHEMFDLEKVCQENNVELKRAKIYLNNDGTLTPWGQWLYNAAKGFDLLQQPVPMVGLSPDMPPKKLIMSVIVSENAFHKVEEKHRKTGDYQPETSQSSKKAEQERVSGEQVMVGKVIKSETISSKWRQLHKRVKQIKEKHLQYSDKIKPHPGAEPKAQSSKSPTDVHNKNSILPDENISRLVTKRVDYFKKVEFSGRIAGENEPLVYDLDLDVFYPATRKSMSDPSWIKGNDTPYIAKSVSDVLTVLPEMERSRAVTDEQRTASLKALGIDLDVVRLKQRIADKPPRRDIPHKISSIWVGTKTIPDHLVKNIVENAREAKSGNEPYAFTLYLSRHSEAAYAHNRAALAPYGSDINVVVLEDMPFYLNFEKSKYYEQYAAAIEGNGGVATNFASAADVLRFQLMKEEGGIYIDMDDRLTKPPSSVSLQTTSDGLLLYPPVSNKALGMVNQYNNSLFGTHKDNSTLELVSEEIHARYQHNKDIYTYRPPLADNDKFASYAKRISSVSGPDVFNAVIYRTCVEETAKLAVGKLWDSPVVEPQGSSLRVMFLELKRLPVTSLGRIAIIGSEHSWKHARR